MAELNKVVSAILRDVAEARSIADTFSKDIALQYGSDPLLKFFPVPRAEVKEMTFEIKFAVGSVEEDPNKRQVKDSKIRALPEKYAGMFLNEMKLFLKPLAAQNPIYKNAFLKFSETETNTNLKSELIRELNAFISSTPDKRITDETLKNHFNKIFYDNIPYPFRFHEFDVFETAPGKKEYSIQLTSKEGKPIIASSHKFSSLQDAFETIHLMVENPDKNIVENSENGKGTISVIDDSGKEKIKNAAIEFSLTENDLKRLGLSKKDKLSKMVAAKFRSKQQTLDSVLNSDFPIDNPLHDTLNNVVGNLKNNILNDQKQIESEPGEMKVDVIMTPEKLQQIPESAISTLRFSAEIKNYSLSQDGDQQNLIPL